MTNAQQNLDKRSKLAYTGNTRLEARCWLNALGFLLAQRGEYSLLDLLLDRLVDDGLSLVSPAGLLESGRGGAAEVEG